MEDLLEFKNEIFQDNIHYNNFIKIVDVYFSGLIDNNQTNKVESNAFESLLFLHGLKKNEVRIDYNEEENYIKMLVTEDSEYDRIYTITLDEYKYIIENLKQPYQYSQLISVKKIFE